METANFGYSSPLPHSWASAFSLHQFISPQNHGSNRLNTWFPDAQHKQPCVVSKDSLCASRVASAKRSCVFCPPLLSSIHFAASAVESPHDAGPFLKRCGSKGFAFMHMRLPLLSISDCIPSLLHMMLVILSFFNFEGQITRR